jgi:tRNA (guanine-N7-)-methyltransferase
MRSFSPEKVPLPPDFRPLPLDLGLPLDVEIGCGAGLHPLRYARANPGRQLLAIERTRAKFEKFQGRVANHEPLPNLIPVHGDAIAWITHGLKPDSVSRYFILYPNPYPKESQRNLRFHNMPFFAWLKETMRKEGELVLASNREFYLREAEDRICRHWGLALLEKQLLPREFAHRTHFEGKYLKRGEPCWNLVFRRIG